MSFVSAAPQRSGRRRTHRQAATALSLITAAAIALTGCVAGPTDPDDNELVTTTPPADGEVEMLRWNTLFEPESLDPAISASMGERTIVPNMCEGLLRLNPDYTVSDGLASVEVSEDRTVLTYTIDPAATFWDGTAVTAEDAVYSLGRSRMPTNGYPVWADYFGSVESIEATGEREVTIRLVHPDLLFEQMMATTASAVVKKAFAEELGPDFGTANGGVMCSGPYKLVRWTSGTNVELERNDAYWAGVTAKVERAIISFLQGDASTTNAILGDSIDGMYEVPYSAHASLAQHGSLYQGKSLSSFWVIPTRLDGPLQDARIRNALFLATNRAAIADRAFAGSAEPAQSLLPPTYYEEVTPARTEGTGASEEELAQARALVEEAGSPTEPIVIAADAGISDALNTMLQAVVEAGTEIGLNISFKSVTTGEYFELFGNPEAGQSLGIDAFGTLYSCVSRGRAEIPAVAALWWRLGCVRERRCSSGGRDVSRVRGHARAELNPPAVVPAAPLEHDADLCAPATRSGPFTGSRVDAHRARREGHVD